MLVLERRHVIGGAAVTEELVPGALCNFDPFKHHFQLYHHTMFM